MPLKGYGSRTAWGGNSPKLVIDFAKHDSKEVWRRLARQISRDIEWIDCAVPTQGYDRAGLIPVLRRAYRQLIDQDLLQTQVAARATGLLFTILSNYVAKPSPRGLTGRSKNDQDVLPSCRALRLDLQKAGKLLCRALSDEMVSELPTEVHVSIMRAAGQAMDAETKLKILEQMGARSLVEMFDGLTDALGAVRASKFVRFGLAAIDGPTARPETHLNFLRRLKRKKKTKDLNSD